MTALPQHLSTTTVAGVGLAGLAAAIGIGRFAFTPLFPLMQEQYGMSLTQGAWLAAANYTGYFVGAAASFALSPNAGSSARWGLSGVALSTLAMGVTTSFSLWCILRLLGGIASAFVLVGTSAWALGHLSAHKRGELAGFAFAGVGLGICLAGLVTLLAAASGMGPAAAWLFLGAIATLVMTTTWTALTIKADVGSSQEWFSAAPLDRPAWILVGCYGAFGFGYIIPATFIPAAARSLVNDPTIFGWTWPLFGLAAGISTIVVSTLFRNADPRKVAGWSLVVMAFGVLFPTLHGTLASLMICAACVGGTFMVMTMAGMQEARRIAKGAPSRLMSALTGAFAIGQFAGPVLVSAGKSPDQALVLPSLLAVAFLLVSAAVLLIRR